MQDQEIVIQINEGVIRINGIICTNNNYDEVMKRAGIGEAEALKIMNLIYTKVNEKKFQKWLDKR